MYCSMPGFPVLHYILEFTQIHVCWVYNVVQPSHLLCSPSPPALNSFPASGYFQMSQFFASGGQSIRASASASVLPMNIPGWFFIGLTDLILQSEGLSKVSNTTVQKHQLLGTQTSLWSNAHTYTWLNSFSWVQFSHSVLSDSLRPHGSQHARPPCPSPTPGVYSNSCPSSRWCHPAISVVPFSSCPQSLPASGSFPISQLFAWSGQSTGNSASASVLLMNTQEWSPLGWTAWISLQSKGLSSVFSNITVEKHQFFRHSAFSTVQLSHPYMTTGKTIALPRRPLLAN